MNITKISKHSIYGFTMVELLIVVVVLALLTLVSGTTYLATMKTARDGKRKVDLENIRSALEVYKSDKSTYPLLTDPITKVDYTLRQILDPSIGKKYITLPSDPKNKLDYYYEPADCTTFASGQQVCNSYILAVQLENEPTDSSKDACINLVAPNGKPACTDTAGGSSACNYCLDPYGQLKSSTSTDDSDLNPGEILLTQPTSE